MFRSVATILSENAARWFALCFFAMAAIAAVPASAQEGATCGIAVTPDGAYRNLGPCPNQNTQRVQPQSKWAAVAISMTNLRTFTAWRSPTKEGAEKTALNLCMKNARNCSIAVSGSHCVAFAASPTGVYGYGPADNYLGADKVALAQCAAHGGTNCAVKADPCSDDGPINQQYTAMAK
jgi:hypothetical protein